MITFSIVDKNGVDVDNGDTLRHFVMKADMQEEYGDNVPNGFYEHKVGVVLRWEEYTYMPSETYGVIELPRSPQYDEEYFCKCFDVPDDSQAMPFRYVPQKNSEEFMGAMDEIEKYTVSRNLPDILREISGFSVTKKAK